MVVTFISDVLKSLSKERHNISEITFVLPSKRASLFLKYEISKATNTPVFSPEILSIEEFVENLSQLKLASNIELIFWLYKTYQEVFSAEVVEDFDSFYKWGQTLLQDFNEIDRYLIPHNEFFNYLHAVKEVDHWSVGKNKTPLITNYLAFWEKLPKLYRAFKEKLLSEGIGYQGLIYRESVENVEHFIQSNTYNKYVFLGFNALNKAEETILQELLQNKIAEIYWDIDAYFYNNPYHEVGLFARNYSSSWAYYKNNPFSWINNNYTQEKSINIYGLAKNIGQAKYIGNLLQEIKSSGGKMENIAVILADENLLIPVLNSIPKEIEDINITMGFPLAHAPLIMLFEQLFNIHKKQNTFYYKEVVNIIGNPFIKQLYFNGQDIASRVIETIEKDNLIYLTSEKIKELAKGVNNNVTDALFSEQNKSPKEILSSSFKLVTLLKNSLENDKKNNKLNLEYLYKIYTIFVELERLDSTYNYIKDVKTLYAFFKELLQSETLDFKGEPLKGLQIMGVLESRAIDFETVIISSVNEGILPSGKTYNSFIPFDLKLQYGLPTYKEKDAIYAYHFYRLLQRAKNIHILYNTEIDALNTGEKSRFITQLEIEGIHKINHQIVIPSLSSNEVSLKTIEKNNALLSVLKQVAQKGLSPSSLTNYIRNPIDFYNKKVLGMAEYEDVEETVAANTLGTVVHNVLETLYKPVVGENLTIENIKAMKPLVAKLVSKNFKKVYKSGDTTKGKNKIIFEIAKRFVSNFLDLEIKDLKNGNQIKILGIEMEGNTQISIPGLDFPVKLIGKVDRVDSYNGTTRIIDYKTGKVLQNQVEVTQWEDIHSDYDKYSKPFQVLMYALLLKDEEIFSLPLEAGIISFKNLGSGFIKFYKKENEERNANKDSLITNEILNTFQQELSKLILEIFNPEINFTEKEP